MYKIHKFSEDIFHVEKDASYADVQGDVYPHPWNDNLQTFS